MEIINSLNEYVFSNSIYLKKKKTWSLPWAILLQIKWVFKSEKALFWSRSCVIIWNKDIEHNSWIKSVMKKWSKQPLPLSERSLCLQDYQNHENIVQYFDDLAVSKLKFLLVYVSAKKVPIQTCSSLWPHWRKKKCRLSVEENKIVVEFTIHGYSKHNSIQHQKTHVK